MEKHPGVPCPQVLCSLISRKERWGLTGRGWLILIMVLLLAALLWLFNIQPFLAQTQRVNCDVLVVEGWVHPFSIQAAIREFRNGHYTRIYTTGGPVVGTGQYVHDFDTSASVGAEALKSGGVPGELVQMVPCRVSGRDRTYSSAQALRAWFQEHHMVAPSFNILTEDVHARRTRLLFQEAFGRDTTIGVIAAVEPDYDAKRWWRYSEGVREVLGESIAYVYAKFLFWPGKR